MEDEDKPNESILYTGKRNIYHLRDLGALIRAKEGAIKRREFIRTSDTRACNFCFYKDHCREHHLEEYFEREFEKKSPLFSYAGMTPDAVRQSKPEKPRSKQKTMRLMKKDNTLRA